MHVIRRLHFTVTDKAHQYFSLSLSATSHLYTEYCTHASVTEGRLTSLITCPSNDMLMTYEDATSTPVGRAAEAWTLDFLRLLRNDPTPSGRPRRLNGHFSFDLIQSTKDGKLYPIECNARVHTAVVLLPLDGVAGCYDSFVKDIKLKGKGQGQVNGIAHGTGNGFADADAGAGPGEGDVALGDPTVLRPPRGILPRSWIYNNIFLRLLPTLLPSATILSMIHPSLPACLASASGSGSSAKRPNESIMAPALEPTLVADDWMPFLMLWHVWWPALLLVRWWNGVRWTRVGFVSLNFV